MTQAAATSLRAWVVTRLRADSDLGALVADRIYNFTPPAETYPSVQVRTTGPRPYDASDGRGKEITVEINCWVRAEGDKDAESILHAIEMSLRDAAPATLTDHSMSNLELEFADTIPEEGGQVRMGYQRWRAVTEEA